MRVQLGQLKYILVLLCVFLYTTSICCAELTQASIENKRQETRNKIKLLKKLEFLETNKLQKNQVMLEKNQNKLEVSKRQYSTKQTRISDLEMELTDTIKDYISVQNTASTRIVNIYKHQNANLLLFLLSSSDLNYFLDRVYYQNIITKQDKEQLTDLRVKSRKIKLIKTNLEKEKRMLSNLIVTMNKQNTSIQKAIDKNETIINKYKNDRIAYEKAERELARQSESIGSMINKTTGKSDVKVTTAFIKPTDGRLSSPFGWRTHPIFKSRTFHSGVDLASPMGTPIHAANAGKVIYSGWYGGYGKVVIVDHGSFNGSPTTSLYAHMSVQKVKVGDKVVKGQVIGLVGSTGYSTGPHCHFEIRINGKPVNPLNYVR